MPDRTPVIAGNWKMYKTPSEGSAFVRDLAQRLDAVTGVQVVVAPPFTGLAAAVRAAEGTPIEVSAQNVFYDDQGAYTGEVAPGMLVDLGVGWAIVGHSERRQLFAETDEGVSRKVRAALDHDLVPIMCVGETEAEREGGVTEQVLSRQVAAGVSRVQPAEAARLVVAYEPVWAIGTGRTATCETAQEAMSYIRRLLAGTFGDLAAEVRLLYGGSVKPDNIGELMAQPDVDGALVGGASLDLESFVSIVNFPGAPSQRS